MNDATVVDQRKAPKTKRPRGLNAKCIKALRRWAKKTRRFVEAYDMAQQMVAAPSHKARGLLRKKLAMVSRG